MYHLFVKSVRMALLLSGLSATTALLYGKPEPGIRLCTVGYLPEVQKLATVAGAEKAQTFDVVDLKTGAVVYSGALGPVVESPQTNERTRSADFGAVQRPGTYVLRIAGVPDSCPFPIAPNALNRSLECVMVGFYGQRCGQAVRFDWNGDTFAHAACHMEDGWLDYLEPAKKGQRREATGGWHDAGDYGKYPLNAAFSTGIMLLAWEQQAEALKTLQLPFIPEHGGNLPDYLAELKFNLDWLLKMQMENGEVVHKLTTLDFGPFVIPESEPEKRYFTVTSRIATLDFAAVGCMAARVFRPYDAAYADAWEVAAKRAWEAARKMPDVLPDTSAFTTGNYFASSESDYKWALIEVRLAFGEAYLTQMERFVFAMAIDNDNRLFDVSWDWGRGYNLGLYSWLFSDVAKQQPAVLAHLQEDLLSAADVVVRGSNKHAYGRGLRAYQWGGNGVLARSVMTLAAAYKVSGEQRYLDAAYAQVAYLYGRNPFSRSFVTGDGFRPPLNPHHRPSGGDQVVAPWPGHVVGGANPTETDWFDETASYRTNETAINWDAALAYALAVFYRP